MTKKKQLWVRNEIVYDPNIEMPSVFDFEYHDVLKNRNTYRRGAGHRKKYRGK